MLVQYEVCKSCGVRCAVLTFRRWQTKWHFFDQKT